MNFLAHIYLSGNDTELIIGNFIGDVVKGKSYMQYPKGIQRGILLHRQIDKFTDEHISSRHVRELFIPEFHKYSGVVVDLVYDYFLCKNWNKYSPSITLVNFIENTHKILLDNISSMPPKMQNFTSKMIENKTLICYSKITGLIKTLKFLSEYRNVPDAYEFAEKTLKQNEDYINHEFLIFFDDISSFVSQYLSS